MSSSHRDYVPRNPAQFRAFMERLIGFVSERVLGDPPEWPDIPKERLDELIFAYSDFVERFHDAEANATSGNRERRDDAQKETTRILRLFVRQFLQFPPVTNGDRNDMGIPNHDTIRTEHTVVTETVAFIIRLGAIRELIVDFWIEGAAHKAKPRGYDGAVIIWGVLDAPPQSPEDLPHHTMASRTPNTLHFEEADRGKTVWIALAWQNERGIIGAWSEYKTAIVP